MYKLSTAILLCLSVVNASWGQTKTFIDQPYIEVTGYADTLVTPNQIFIKIIISEKDSRDKVSVELQENGMIAAFKELGIKTETDLVTSDILSNYRFYILKQKDVIKTKAYLLKVPDAQMAGRVFVRLEELGISNTSIDRVDHSDLENIKNTCRTRAAVSAYDKAYALTTAIHQGIGHAIHITENAAVGQLQGRAPEIMFKEYDKNRQDKFEAPNIEFEKIKVSATVNAKFILK